MRRKRHDLPTVASESNQRPVQLCIQRLGQDFSSSKGRQHVSQKKAEEGEIRRMKCWLQGWFVNRVMKSECERKRVDREEQNAKLGECRRAIPQKGLGIRVARAKSVLVGSLGRRRVTE